MKVARARSVVKSPPLNLLIERINGESPLEQKKSLLSRRACGRFYFNKIGIVLDILFAFVAIKLFVSKRLWSWDLLKVISISYG